MVSEKIFLILQSGDAKVEESVTTAVHSSYAKGKPIKICITPASVGALTLGGENSSQLEMIWTLLRKSCNAPHSSDDVVVDLKNKVVNPAYMLGSGLVDVRKGIAKLINELLKLTH